MNTDNKLPNVLTINNDILSFDDQFNNMLDKITQTVDRASNLVDVQTIDLGKIDEDRLMKTIDDLSQAQKLTRNVSSIRSALRKYLNNRRDNIMSQFDNILAKAKYDQLSNYNAKAKQLKKDLSNYRINQRWNKLKETFDLNIQHYPLITKLAPQLTDFNTFRLRHPKLVTGAKNYKITSKQLAIINNELFSINDCLTDLNNNIINLKRSYQIAVLNNFIQNPTKENYLNLKNNFLIKQQEEEKLAREAKENAKTEKSSEKAKISKAKQDTLTQQITKARTWLANYVSINNRKYGNLAQSARQKMNLVYDLEHMLDNTASPLSELLLQEKDIEKRSEIMLSMLKLIINA